MALHGTLGSVGLDDVMAFLSTHGVEGVLTIFGAAASLRMLVLPDRVLVPQGRKGRLSAETIDQVLSRASRIGRASSRRLSRTQVDELVRRAKSTCPKRTGRLGKPALDDILARAAAARVSAAQATGRIQRADLESLLERADALDDQDARRHKAAATVHAVSSEEAARFEFMPCPVPPEVVRELEALGGVALEPLALLMEVARLKDERGREKRSATRSARRKRVEEPGGPALRGDVDGIGLAALLQTLRERRRAGTLVLAAADREERLYFEEGEAFALRVEADDWFAHDMLGADASDSVRALVKSAAVDERALTAADQTRLRDQFLDVLFGESATFAFHEGELPPEVKTPRRGTTRIALQTERFLLEAIQRMVEWDALREPLQDGAAVLRFTSPDVKLTTICQSNQPEVLTLIDGRQTFDEVVRAARAKRIEAARAVAGLIAAQKLVAVEDPARRDRPPTGRHGAPSSS